MSEGFLKNPLEEIKSVETERLARYRTVEQEILETHEDGSKTERVLECNGSLHRRCIDKIFYGENGEVVFADQLSREELGPCDGEHP
ncbi:MAG: hypothetical protein A3C84_02890 [Candidatus Ryanbacteria bacterium RIFCSPHIGHO2_02_FULL_48_12]|jgi:hypothetical protein|uniref:Uncharacterized protein n=1 Tax=Candidatus Ryanbacteria bacterium RIFCSPHIGHO2_01_FULL_48_27 TaxID=1802115 RepID=A0A1G2G5T9_9BACT|nr:MAG: hypothetical protein A2756_01360 [Candidatus Ryanbacteria bacterium RIFCSPHIGHO2_01_FULL_48_27]OGZ49048.1 MAG: hypothetical protein A3C84_02890 [Candidatus Ryanbacteria bacterium RIFCSPHIGHO2_02_FULL_48_12]